MTVVRDSSRIIISGQERLTLQIIQTLNKWSNQAILGNNEAAVILMDPYYQHNIDNETSFQFDAVLNSDWFSLVNRRLPIGPNISYQRHTERERVSQISLSKNLIFSCNEMQ